MTDEPLNPIKEEAEAIARIAATRDGALLHRHLRRILELCIDIESDGALRQHNGRRSLARDLMRQMAQGLDERRDDPGNDPILQRAGTGVAVSGRARRDPRSFPRVDSYPDDYSGPAQPS